MIRAAFAIPGDLETPTGGYRYAREILARAPAFGVELIPLALPGAFPYPSADDLAATARAFQSLAPGTPILLDGLAGGALTEEVLAAAQGPILALVHHPLALETGVSRADAARFRVLEKDGLARAAMVAVTSRDTGRILERDYGVAEDRRIVAEPGVARFSMAPGSDGETVEILAVGAVSRRKGYDVLLDALVGLEDFDWRLTVAGATDRAPEVFAELHARIEGHGLASRVRFLGAVDETRLQALYAGADLFVLSSRYEGYGMVLAEAMAHGLPIVTTTGGAAGDTAPDRAALKVPPDDVTALRNALHRALSAPALRRDLARAAHAHAQGLPTWDDAARLLCSALAGLAKKDVP